MEEVEALIRAVKEAREEGTQVLKEAVASGEEAVRGLRAEHARQLEEEGGKRQGLEHQLQVYISLYLASFVSI